jgi:hypothetical protein
MGVTRSRTYGLAMGPTFENRLSGLLANITGDSAYLEAAFASFEFMHNHLFEPNSLTVYNNIQAENCTVDMSALSENSAIFLEGVAILGAISGNATLKDL